MEFSSTETEGKGVWYGGELVAKYTTTFKGSRSMPLGYLWPNMLSDQVPTLLLRMEERGTIFFFFFP